MFPQYAVIHSLPRVFGGLFLPEFAVKN